MRVGGGNMKLCVSNLAGTSDIVWIHTNPFKIAAAPPPPIPPYPSIFLAAADADCRPAPADPPLSRLEHTATDRAADEVRVRLCETDGAARGVGGGSADGARRDERQGLAEEASSNAQGDEGKGPHAKRGRRALLVAGRWGRDGGERGETDARVIVMAAPRILRPHIWLRRGGHIRVVL